MLLVIFFKRCDKKSWWKKLEASLGRVSFFWWRNFSFRQKVGKEAGKAHLSLLVLMLFLLICMGLSQKWLAFSLYAHVVEKMFSKLLWVCFFPSLRDIFEKIFFATWFFLKKLSHSFSGTDWYLFLFLSKCRPKLFMKRPERTSFIGEEIFEIKFWKYFRYFSGTLNVRRLFGVPSFNSIRTQVGPKWKLSIRGSSSK